MIRFLEHRFHYKHCAVVMTSFALCAHLALTPARSDDFHYPDAHPLAGTSANSTQQSFMLSPTDGYGISDCLISDRSCGKIVADAWCQAHGRAAALAYGLASDITASLPPAAKNPRQC
jgi:hypothetical protein